MKAYCESCKTDQKNKSFNFIYIEIMHMTDVYILHSNIMIFAHDEEEEEIFTWK